MVERHAARGAFGWLWGANTGAALGDGFAMVAFPLLIAGMTRDPLVVSLLQAAAGLPWLLFGLLAGTLADRWDRRTLMWRTDVARFGVVAALAGLVAVDALTVPLLLAGAFLFATGSTLIRSAAPALLPALVPPDRLADANGRLQAGATAAGSFVGPALAGALYASTPWLPVFGQTLALAASAACLRRLPVGVSRVPAVRSRSFARDTWEGLRWLACHRVLRALAAGTALLAAATGILLSVLVLHALQTLGLPAAGYGGLISLYAAGSLVGAVATPPLNRHLGTRTCLLLAAAVGALSIAALAAATIVLTAAASLMALGVAAMLWNTTTVTIRQQSTPDQLLGRVSSAFNVLSVGAAPVAAPIGGVIAATTSTASALAAAAVLCGGAFATLAWLLPAKLEPAARP